MDFSLSEETMMLRDSARRFFREKCPTSSVREVLETEAGFSPDVFKEMAKLGWLGLIHDEAYGGFGGSFFDLFILFEEMGRAVLPSPFFSSAILSGLLIDEAGDPAQKETCLPPIIQGEKIMTMALLDEQGRYDYEDPAALAREVEGGEYELSGARLLVPYAHVADQVLVCARLEGSKGQGPTIFRVDPKTDGLKLVPLDILTREKTFAVIFSGARVSSDSILGSIGRGDAYLKNIRPKAAALKCGEMLGGMERVVEMTVAYVKERHQFGRPLGALQAVHHLCADMAAYLETTRLIAYQAAWLLSEGLSCAKEMAMAKAWCSDAYKKCTWIGHQLHGGIGFTEEHDMHLYYKHAKASEMAFGGSWLHRSLVADELGI